VGLCVADVTGEGIISFFEPLLGGDRVTFFNVGRIVGGYVLVFIFEGTLLLLLLELAESIFHLITETRCCGA